MSDFAIQVKQLSKRYTIGESHRPSATLRDSIAQLFQSPFLHSETSPSRNYIWALREISFQVERGEVIGIIGPNGAGKSTLLKILSRITEPTTGYARVSGRIGSLLEVGTGFHEELTGRENIYLNGAILGMKKRELDRKFEEIVAFAEIEKFVDTPVKHYSSGMCVRLAFAVAAHLDPEILLVDEVLSVGDAAFQKKCFGKMGDVTREGKTVLFVSHNMTQVRRLCKRGLWLDHGHCRKDGEVLDVVASYQTTVAGIELDQIELRLKESHQKGFVSWKILEAPADLPNAIHQEAPFTLEVVLSLTSPISHAYHELVLRDTSGRNIGGWGQAGLSLGAGVYKISYRFPSLPVRPGVYYWYATLWDGADKVDTTYLLPEFVVSTPEHSILTEEWAGVINLPCSINIGPF